MNVKIDSRKIEKGDTFVALRGIDHDGHAYIRQAIETAQRRSSARKEATRWKPVSSRIPEHIWSII